MAQENFYKLKEKKQERILTAINECLTKYDYDTLTINNIVDAAEISRGSFYDYFLDKKDAVDTFVMDYIRKMTINFLKIIEKSDAKLFDGIINAYSVIKKSLVNDIYFNVIKNIKYFSDFANGIIFSKKFNERYDYIIDWITDNTYEGKNKLLDRREIKTVLELTSSILTQSTFRFLIEEDKKEIEKDYRLKIEIIKNGILKNKVGV